MENDVEATSARRKNRMISAGGGLPASGVSPLRSLLRRYAILMSLVAALAVPNGIACGIGMVNVNPQDDGKIGLTIAACTASALLLSHGIWELSLLGEMGRSDGSSQDSARLSLGPTLLDEHGSWGLQMAGTF